MSAAPTHIYVSRGPGETRAALTAGDTVLDVLHIRGLEPQPGAIYAGRVVAPAPGSGDVFVEIGMPPHGLLEAKGRKFTQGQLIAVEVLTPARADKGHKLKFSAMALPAGQGVGIVAPAPNPVLAWWQAYGASVSSVIVEPREDVRHVSALLNGAHVTPPQADHLSWADIDAQIELALEPVVPLPSGGRLVIEQTSALAAIDIDAGASSIDVANREAMPEAARQIRLRNLAGRIVIDLIPTRAKQRLLAAFKAACEADPAETRVMGLSPSGLIDVVRARHRPTLSETLHAPDAVAYRAARLAVRELVARKVARVAVHVAPAVAALFNERLHSVLAEARAMAKGEIDVIARPDFPPARCDVAPT